LRFARYTTCIGTIPQIGNSSEGRQSNLSMGTCTKGILLLRRSYIAVLTLLKGRSNPLTRSVINGCTTRTKGILTLYEGSSGALSKESGLNRGRGIG